MPHVRARGTRLTLRALPLAAIACAAACGGAAIDRAPEPPRDAAALGRSVFLSQCQGCHALGALGAPRPPGGDLAHYDMTATEVASFARIMPTSRPLRRSELAAVSSFVSSVQRRERAGPRTAREPRATRRAR